MVVTFGLGAVGRCCSGLWRFLAARVDGRMAVELERQRYQGTVELERERNIGTMQVIALLPPGAELLESEPAGRLRVVRIAPALPFPPLGHPADPDSVGDLTE